MNVQIFITSHSIEALNKILIGQTGDCYDVNVYTMYTGNSSVHVRTLVREKAVNAAKCGISSY